MKLVILLVMMIGLASWPFDDAQAMGLQMQPLLYRAGLHAGERKIGYVDISNPTAESVRLRSSVQAFRPVDEQGGLEFYDDAMLNAGIIPDLTEFELGPHEAVRMYFMIDGTRLPEGDVFAALLVSITPPARQGAAAVSLRLGTLLVLEHGTPGPRQADVESLTLARLQAGRAISGRYVIRNMAPPEPVTGFFPSVTVSLTPLGVSQRREAPLVTGGARRQVDFELTGARIGIYRLSVRSGESEHSRWIAVATGYWRWVLPGVVVLAMISPLLFRLVRRRSRGYFRAG